MTAIGVLRAAYMEGLRVPDDVSVIGLDDIDFAEFTLPPLTTIRLSRADLARAAFEALRQQAEDPGNPKIAARVPGLHQPGGARIDGCAGPALDRSRLRLIPKHHARQHIPVCHRPGFRMLVQRRLLKCEGPGKFLSPFLRLLPCHSLDAATNGSDCVDAQSRKLPDSSCQVGSPGSHYVYGGSSGGNVGDAVVGGSVTRGGFGGTGGSGGGGDAAGE
jgi:uncharacterized membrane protein YgcG